MGLYLKEQKYIDLFNTAADNWNIPVALLLAHARQESNFNPNAYRSEPAIGDGSTGLVQILLRTAQGIDSNATKQKLLDPTYNLDIAAHIISNNIDRYAGNGQYAITDAIAAYNAGTAFRSNGTYTNSQGSSNVQKYVDNVVKYMNDYNNWLADSMPAVEISLSDIILSIGVSFLILKWIINRKK